MAKILSESLMRVELSSDELVEIFNGSIDEFNLIIENIGEYVIEGYDVKEVEIESNLIILSIKRTP